MVLVEGLTKRKSYKNTGDRRIKMKRKWKRPELVVLVRSRPEESVLDHCKIGPNPSTPTGYHGACFENNPENPPCGFCRDYGAT